MTTLDITDDLEGWTSGMWVTVLGTGAALRVDLNTSFQFLELPKYGMSSVVLRALSCAYLKTPLR